VKVTAACDIVTERGFIVARKGIVGRVKYGHPHDPCNHCKVLVFFGKRKHGYWCSPKQLLADGSLERFIAWPPPEKKVMAVPKGNQHDYHFGKNLRLIREARKLSQIGLGKAMAKNGLRAAQSTICYREQRPDCPSGRFINAAAKSLDVPAFMFFVSLEDCDVIESAGEFVQDVRKMLCLVDAGDKQAKKKLLSLAAAGVTPPKQEGNGNGVPHKSRKVRLRASSPSRPYVRAKVTQKSLLAEWSALSP